MKKELCVERYFVSYTWYFLGIVLFYIIIKDGLINPDIGDALTDISFFGIFAVINLIKKYLIDFGIYEMDYFYLRSRLVEIILVCFAFFYLGFHAWIAAFLFGEIVLSTLLKSKQMGFHVLLLFIAVTAVFAGFSSIINPKNQSEYITYLFLIPASFIGGRVLSGIWKNRQEEFKINKEDYEKVLAEKNKASKLAEELMVKDEKTKDKLKKMEEAIEELKITLNKYYEFHHISSIVNSIYDINGLLKFINETVAEIIECDNSTILLFEPKRGSLEVRNTNIADEDELEKLKKNINNDVIFDIIENGVPFVVNFVESSDYEFVMDRDVKSFVCMPITTTKKKYGVILIESKAYNKFCDENQKLIMLIGNQLSTSIENLELYKKMKELATTDGLTGVYNRLYFQERLSKELKIALENNYSLSLVIVDLDHFKRVNDTYSHLIGDKVLKVVTTVIKNSIRRSDMVARYGGEEFIILFPNMDIKRAEETCESIRKKIQATQITNRDINLTVTASFGIANYPINALGEENLVKAADRALYDAKESGRNCTKVSQEKLL